MENALADALHGILDKTKSVIQNVTSVSTNPFALNENENKLESPPPEATTTTPPPTVKKRNKLLGFIGSFGLAVVLIFIFSFIYFGQGYTTTWQKFVFSIVAVVTTETLFMIETHT
jgi:hypothetical protein